METLQMAFNILDITRKCMQLKCSKTTIYCWILNVGFSLKIYIIRFYPIERIISHLFIDRQISTALYKLKSLSSLQGRRNWGLEKMTDTQWHNEQQRQKNTSKNSFHDSTLNWSKFFLHETLFNFHEKSNKIQ